MAQSSGYAARLPGFLPQHLLQLYTITLEKSLYFSESLHPFLRIIDIGLGIVENIKSTDTSDIPVGHSTDSRTFFSLTSADFSSFCLNSVSSRRMSLNASLGQASLLSGQSTRLMQL